MSKFEIGAFAKSVGAAVSKLDTREQLQYIDIDLLDESADNFYALSDLQPLADSIAMDGLQQPLVVTPGEGGRYTVLSGHRRRAAVKMLLGEGAGEELRRLPCLVRTYESPSLAQLQLILANSTARQLTSAEKMRQAQRTEILLYQLKEEGYQFPGRMRDQVAAACKVSAPKLARLKVIREHLVPEYMAVFAADKLPEQAAYALARMPRVFQKRLWRVLQGAAPTGRRAEELLDLEQDGCTWEPAFSCPDGKPCQRGDVFLRHDAECLAYELCKGERCCLQCPSASARYGPCERMCSKAKALRKAGRDEEAEQEAGRREAQQRRYQEEMLEAYLTESPDFAELLRYCNLSYEVLPHELGLMAKDFVTGSTVRRLMAIGVVAAGYGGDMADDLAYELLDDIDFHYNKVCCPLIEQQLPYLQKLVLEQEKDLLLKS